MADDEWVDENDPIPAYGDQPDVVIESSSVVEYVPLFVDHPSVLVETSVEHVYTPPASTGGQPNVVITTETWVDLGEQVTYTDITGETEIFFETSGEFSVEIEAVPIPATIDRTNVKRISVTMPKPTSFDEFGRPN